MLTRIRWEWGSQSGREADLVVQTCRWVMSTDFVQLGEVLGLIALSSHEVMSTFRIEGAITGSMERGWYCTWSISGIQVFTVGLSHELGQCKVVVRVRALRLIALGCPWVMSTPRIEGVISRSLNSCWICNCSIIGIQAFCFVVL